MEVSLICVGTPTDETGRTDVRALSAVAASIGRGLRDATHFHTVVMRSTLPPGMLLNQFLPNSGSDQR